MCHSKLTECFAELTEFATELSEFSLPKQCSQNSIPPVPQSGVSGAQSCLGLRCPGGWRRGFLEKDPKQALRSLFVFQLFLPSGRVIPVSCVRHLSCIRIFEGTARRAFPRNVDLFLWFFWFLSFFSKTGT